MIRNYLYAGVVLIVVAIVIFYLVASYITAGTPTMITNLTVQRGGMQDVRQLVNSSGISILFVFTDTPTNIYFLNQSVFEGLSSYLAGNSLRSAYAYVSAHDQNASDVFKNNSTAVKELSHYSNGTSSNYYVYAVVDSTPGSESYNTIVNASVVYKSYSYSDWVNHSGEALAAIIALIVGVALLIYGVVKKPPEVPATATPVAEAPAEAAKPKRRRKR
ncbi:MAG: hypothetical protein KGH94_02885 [Candidatus Micrarchaeota archaeon]|nr:hypothetical protein [Candidatus Micrarchaeota archaeon]